MTIQLATYKERELTTEVKLTLDELVEIRCSLDHYWDPDVRKSFAPWQVEFCNRLHAKISGGIGTLDVIRRSSR